MLSKNITRHHLGNDSKGGIDGHDSYWLLTCNEDDLTPDEAREFMLSQVYAGSTSPGGQFVSGVLAVQAEHSTNKVICTVMVRYDV